MENYNTRPNIIVVLFTLPFVIIYILIKYILSMVCNGISKVIKEIINFNHKIFKWCHNKTNKILLDVNCLFEKYIIISCMNFIDNCITKIDKIFYTILDLIIFYLIIPVWKFFIWCNDKIHNLNNNINNFVKNYLFDPIWSNIKYFLNKSNNLINGIYAFIKNNVFISIYQRIGWFYHIVNKIIIDFYKSLTYLILESKIIIGKDIILPFIDGFKWWLNYNLNNTKN